MRLAAVLFLFASAAAMVGAQTAASQNAAPQTTPQWTYLGRTGPINWDKLDPANRACSQGQEQSPIDIRGAHLNKALQPIQFHYLAGPVSMENTGNLIVTHVSPGNYIVVNGMRYDLERLEFHQPSEHAIKGKLTDMEVQFIHKSADGKMAAIAERMTLDRGEANATLATLWEHLPSEAHTTEKVAKLVNPGGLLPGDRGYWTYTGSLTTPPCTEGVQWFVMEQDLSISRQQLRELQRLFKVSSRTLRDGHGRSIQANE